MMPILVLLVLLLVWHPWAAPRTGWQALAEPYRFSTVHWEAQTLLDKGRHLLAARGRAELTPQEQRQVVEAHFSLVGRMEKARLEDAALRQAQGGVLAALEAQRAALEDSVEDIIEGQISQVLREEGLALKLAPLEGVRGGPGFEPVLPPVKLELAPTPHLLVVSPREHINLAGAILLRENLSLEEIEHLESAAEKLGVSALVTRVGGLATYPSLIPERASLERCLDIAAHEWLHSYLLFSPLGQHYGDSYEMRTINETVASMGGQELSRLVLRRYYAEYAGDTARPGAGEAVPSRFHQVLRETRLAVDGYLERGEVEAAEALMEERRRMLAAEGYYIRRLNQAYFAFHGAYADSPASVSPVGAALAQLRAKSGSLGGFIKAVSEVSSYDELKALLR